MSYSISSSVSVAQKYIVPKAVLVGVSLTCALMTIAWLSGLPLGRSGILCVTSGLLTTAILGFVMWDFRTLLSKVARGEQKNAITDQHAIYCLEDINHLYSAEEAITIELLRANPMSDLLERFDFSTLLKNCPNLKSLEFQVSHTTLKFEHSTSAENQRTLKLQHDVSEYYTVEQASKFSLFNNKFNTLRVQLLNGEYLTSSTLESILQSHSGIFKLSLLVDPTVELDLSAVEEQFIFCGKESAGKYEVLNYRAKKVDVFLDNLDSNKVKTLRRFIVAYRPILQVHKSESLSGERILELDILPFYEKCEKGELDFNPDLLRDGYFEQDYYRPKKDDAFYSEIKKAVEAGSLYLEMILP